MKRLKFKSLFDGVGNAIKLIPESYKENGKVFEMTDGVETYKVKWEGTLAEGKANILTASGKDMMTESLDKMKHLMGYNSKETLGTPTTADRINENKRLNENIEDKIRTELTTANDGPLNKFAIILRALDLAKNNNINTNIIANVLFDVLEEVGDDGISSSEFR